jgi:hypothetical protein
MDCSPADGHALQPDMKMETWNEKRSKEVETASENSRGKARKREESSTRARARARAQKILETI